MLYLACIGASGEVEKNNNILHISSHIQQKHSLFLHGALHRQSITKIPFKGRELPPVEKNCTDLDKVLSQLFRPLVKNDLLLFLVVFSSFKIIPSFQKIDYHLLEVPGKE